MKSVPTIQRVELSCYHIPIHCPFCGKQIFVEDDDEEEESQVDSCPHLLFIATDYGFVFRSARFNTLKKLDDGVTDENAAAGITGGFDAFTDALEIKDGVKFAVYVPAPGFMGAYYGFAPTPED
jgi:hypothetical protein